MKVPTALAGRLLLLLPMAFCIFLILDSQDRIVRLVAVLALILLEQARQWLMISGMKALAKGK